jgi:hypothetical protein
MAGLVAGLEITLVMSFYCFGGTAGTLSDRLDFQIVIYVPFSNWGRAMAEHEKPNLVELCELVAKERDSKKLRALFADITDLLDAEDQRRKSAATIPHTEADTKELAPDEPGSPTLCRICKQLVDLSLGSAVDEDGKAVHESCYVKEILARKPGAGKPRQA